MSISTPVYTTREVVKAALDIKLTARSDAQVDRAIESASRAVEGLTHRTFYPLTATKYFDWPNYQWARPWRLWLDENEVVSLTSLVSGGTTISASDYFLEPVNSGPPYDHIEIDLASSASFSTGATHQRSIAATGVFGYDDVTTPAGALSASSINASVTTINVTNSAIIGVGDLLTIDTERLLATEKTMLTTGQTLQTPVGANLSEVAIAVTTGSSYAVGEVILLDSERMLIVDISGNTLTVKRAWDGTPIATHSGSTIYALRTITVVRGVLGSTAASHNSSASILKQVYPATIVELTVAEAVSTIQQETSGYARTVGSADNEREATGRGLKDIRNTAYIRYARQARIGAI